MMFSRSSIGILGVAVAFSMTASQAQDLGAVTTPGAHIQRTMKLLADSTPEKRNRVRVLFYGQSITCQSWWRAVAKELKERFPAADLDIKNRAIGGFTAPNLIATTEYDLFPFYPDLLIFHVYGSAKMDKWEEIIRLARTRTATEILLWTHHDAGRKRDYPQSERIREIAVKYDCGLVDVEAQWQKVLAEKGLEPKAFLSDSVHLNKEGCALLASMITPFLVRTSKLMTDQSRGLAEDISMDDASVKVRGDGSVELAFTGNRIDAIALPGVGTDGLAAVTIDGKSSAEIDGTFALTRPSNAPYTWFPAVKVIKNNAPLVAEKWTLEFLEFTPDASEFTYRATGSVTGEDGEGSKDKPFVSKSGRVVIDGGANWHRVPWSLTYKKKKMPETFSVNWRVYPMFVDELRFPAVKNAASERAVTLVQGLPNGPHTLRLIPHKGTKLDLRGFRVYHPALP
ncbi:MAG: SGNH/GDSL hydrolase family protein [Lentisphaerae bacterium]|jgi:hypothetical protein|nr:SGNH/GDSL hydrolase family protein [Lentisphaerota bacterium]MBT4819129.1 SGNH/GDSL hydrolase family protein [Lentisphaerota bacterium]MBT5605771.1 SGNH/GDSL hydrolase family protein [Lentisphaerota bacterium]MBT7053906.1 SGNH/GDSL hydrolase family protein [Lentisphaerota bacterium]MBT7843952.1 SGNH/GDSL hydrolase family protein [Lentisphaerota bacterium]